MDRARVSAGARLAVLVAALLYPLGLGLYLHLVEPGANAMPIDFAAFWSAARLAAGGSAVAAFDWPSLSNVMALPESAGDAYFSWQYPASFLLLLLPLGFLGFAPALFVFVACGLAAFWFALRPWAADRPVARDFVIASPALVASAFAGNTSLLWTSALLAALWFRAASNHLLAGAFIALLTLKPQLGPMIAIALIAARDWRTIAWAALFSAVILVLSALAFGIDYWPAFRIAVENISKVVAETDMISRTMVTWFAFIRQHIGPGEAAFAVQAGFTLIAVLCTASLWASRSVDPDLRIAGLLLAILTGAVYAFQYETLLSTAAILFLARAGLCDSTAGRLWALVLWLLPLPHRVISGAIVADYAAPILAASLLACTYLACTYIALQRARAGQADGPA